ncbi:MAG: hypothetical protein LBI76_09540 [Comamonas sp.]|nr:hypothetical protein [Comamonas sp.]
MVFAAPLARAWLPITPSSSSCCNWAGVSCSKRCSTSRVCSPKVGATRAMGMDWPSWRKMVLLEMYCPANGRSTVCQKPLSCR